MGAVRGTTIAVVCCLVLTLLTASTPPPAPKDLPPAPGKLLLAEPTALVDPRLAAIGASVARIRYASRSGLDNRPIEVTGVVFTPQACRPAAAGGPGSSGRSRWRRRRT